ncbi:uncharacterized protein LOC131955034 [Physella acuta]|uniref:uncharacterized protein LOC131955034 n=1 Tax=Physella acuta TaxID=109671 RepID=UPI0027DDE5F5|nr:uncharacterized protein LOC131955034 [Physella acuta]
MDNQGRSMAGQVCFRIGQFILLAGEICFIVAIATSYWVVRPVINFKKEGINPNETVVTQNFGIFHACRQPVVTAGDDHGRHLCGALWDNLNYISPHAARYVQFVMIIAALLYGVGVVLEIIQLVPIHKYRNFIAKNRMVEMFSSIATVLVLQGILIFAGEIKSKAQRVSGQEQEQSGWSFIIAVIGLLLCIIGLVLVTMFRELPIPGLEKEGGSWLKATKKRTDTTSSSRLDS